jgi:hypothetical protein
MTGSTYAVKHAIAMIGLSGALAKYEFQRSVKLGPISFKSLEFGLNRIPASHPLKAKQCFQQRNADFKVLKTNFLCMKPWPVLDHSSAKAVKVLWDEFIYQI